MIKSPQNLWSDLLSCFNENKLSLTVWPEKESVTWVVGVGDGGADGVCLQGEGGRRRNSWTEKQQTQTVV